MRISFIAVALVSLLPRPAEALSIVGFSKRGHQVLYRDDDGDLKLFSRTGKRLPATKGIERRCRFGAKLKTSALKLDAEKRRLSLVWKGQTIRVWKASDECAPVEVVEAKLARNRLAVALVLRQECEPRARPLVLSLAAVARRLANQGTALARRGKRKASAQALKQAALLHSGSPFVLYSRARAAALAADQHGAVSLLRRLKAMRSAAARRLFVKAQFDKDFRLVEGSTAFKGLYRF